MFLALFVLVKYVELRKALISLSYVSSHKKLRAGVKCLCGWNDGCRSP